jgi:F-type H+-transporting ATPase subunit beta
VTDTGAPISVPVGPETLGRIINVIGEPIDERGPVGRSKAHRADPRAKAPEFVDQSTEAEILVTGIKVVDLLAPTPRAARSACSAAPASARPCSSGADQQHRQGHGGYSVFAGVGERTREGNDLYHEMIESGVIKDADGNGTKARKVALVFGQMNEPPGARARVALSGLTMAEYFRDQEGQDVLFFVDNIFRFTQAGSEVSALLGRIPSAVGYQPTLATDMGALQERITSTKKGSITSVQAIYVPADDLTDPAPATSFAHLDATTVLSRDQIAELGIYPGGRPARLDLAHARPRVVGEEHYNRRPRVQRRCRSTSRCRTSSPSSAWTSCRKRTSWSSARRKIQRFLSQPFHVAEVFTGTPGKFVQARGHHAASRASSTGEYDHLPEAAFYMVGTIDEAVEEGQEAGERGGHTPHFQRRFLPYPFPKAFHSG